MIKFVRLGKRPVVFGVVSLSVICPEGSIRQQQQQQQYNSSTILKLEENHVHPKKAYVS